MESMMTSVALGGVVGLLLALTGAGGGILAVPLLVFWQGLSVASAAPVGLIAVGLSAALGAALGWRDGIVRYRAAALIGGVGMALAPLGVAAGQRIPNAPLTVVFAGVLACAAWRMFMRAARSPDCLVARGADARLLPCVIDARDGRIVWTRPCARALGLTGALSGLLSGLLGVGGGFVIVPALTRYTELSARSVVATSLAVIALVATGSIGASAWRGAILWPVALPFAAGAMAALLVGRRIAARVAGPRLQQCFAVVSALVALLLLARGLGWIRMRAG